MPEIDEPMEMRVRREDGEESAETAPPRLTEARIREIIREEIAAHHRATAPGRVFGF
jgi:hypothetical protein